MWLNQGKWQVNPLNFSDEVRRDYEARPEIFMLDSTIRNMTAIPGSRWDVSGAVAMATLAAEIGVRIIEIDVISMTSRQRRRSWRCSGRSETSHASG